MGLNHLECNHEIQLSFYALRRGEAQPSTIQTVQPFTVLRCVPLLLSACILHEEGQQLENFGRIASDRLDLDHGSLFAHGTEYRRVVPLGFVDFVS